ncbi:MAG: hypothetical protein KGS72_17475 [Cyanobacteria bacterium REEB67]|nr:hypothetical protein [Cyanobacteria bacterium REEB67]
MLSKKKLHALALVVVLSTTLGFDVAMAKGAAGKKSAVVKKTAASAREQAICKSPRFVKALQSYQKRDYRDAISNLEYVDAHGGCCEWTHYYLGLCYQGINQVGLAYRHYEWVTARAKNASLRKYAQYGCDSVTYYAANRTYGGQGGILAAAAYSQSSGGGGGSGCGSFG